MAHVFTLTDGTTTISLVASGIWLENYDMKVPEGDDATVVDTVDIIINAASSALVQTQAQALDALLHAAVRYQTTHTGPRVYVTAQLIGDTVWRAQLIGARMELAEDALAVWGNYKVRATLYLERVPYWEGTEVGIPLANSNGSWDGSAATGLTIFNCNDGAGASPTKHENWVEIAGANVAGALPAPLKIELKNTYGSAVTWNAFHLANNAFSDPAAFPHWLEAEARTAGGTVTANSDASGGNENRLTSYSSGLAVAYTLSASLLQKAAGRWFRLLLAERYRTATISQAETVQATIYDSTGAFPLWNGPEVLIGQSNIGARPHHDLGALPFPPGGYDANYGALTLKLTFRFASGTATTHVDYMQLTPTDSYRVLQVRPTPIANNALIVDNGIDGIAYVETSGARAPYVMPRGAPLMVFPGKLQHLYVLADHVDAAPNIENKWLLRVFYRPRRVSI